MCLSANGVEDEEDLYDCVYDDDEGGEVYEDLMKVELVQPQVRSLKCFIYKHALGCKA